MRNLRSLVPCPVCQRPFHADAGIGSRCVECGWELISGFRAGETTPEQRDRHGVKWVAACAQHDTLAVARALHAPDEHGAPFGDIELRALTRGVVSADVEQRCFERADQDVIDTEGTGLRAARALIRTLVGTPHHRIAFVELGSTGIAVHWAATTTAGAVDITAPAVHQEWRELLPGLADDGPARRLRLAGGVPSLATGTNVDTPADSVNRVTAVDHVRARLPDLTGHMVIQVRRVVRWGLVDQIADALRDDFSANEVAFAGAVADLISELVASLPLQVPVSLVVAAQDASTQQLVPTLVSLFAKGDEPHEPPLERSVTVYAPPIVTGPVTLPVVADFGGDRDWVPMTMVSVTTAPNDTLTVTVQLLAGPRIIFVAPDEAEIDDTPLVDLIASLPATLSLAPMIDLAVTVDLCGDVAAVAGRLALARSVICEAAARAPGSLAVAAVGYGDHSYQRPTRVQPNFLRVLNFGPPTRIESDLAGWQPDPSWAHRFGAPVEDALREVNRLSWRDGAKRTLLMLGDRPPCDPVGGGRVYMCPHQIDWHKELTTLKQRSTQTAVVVAPYAWADGARGGLEAAKRADEIWQAISGGARFEPVGGTSTVLLDRLGLQSPGAVGRFPFAMRHPITVLSERESR